MALTRRYYRMHNDAGMCTGCSAANVPVWAAKFNKAQFCGQCWLDFLLSKPWSRERVEPDPGRQLVFKWKSSPDSCTDEDESWSDYDTDTQPLKNCVFTNTCRMDLHAKKNEFASCVSFRFVLRLNDALI